MGVELVAAGEMVAANSAQAGTGAVEERILELPWDGGQVGWRFLK